ncbi:MAG: hypothetical protein HOP29_00200 [Phycisphaerales bacterium]|nr:hypothetical protein [Phycisphaerales bacterium]
MEGCTYDSSGLPVGLSERTARIETDNPRPGKAGSMAWERRRAPSARPAHPLFDVRGSDPERGDGPASGSSLEKKSVRPVG